MTSATATAATMEQTKEQMQPKSNDLKPEISPEAQQQQQEAGVPPAKPTGALQDMDPNALMEKRNKVGPAAAAVLFVTLLGQLVSRVQPKTSNLQCLRQHSTHAMPSTSVAACPPAFPICSAFSTSLTVPDLLLLLLLLLLSCRSCGSRPSVGSSQV